MRLTQIRRITTSDAARARALRLEMLADAPLAFIMTLAEAAELPHADYTGFVTRCSSGQQNAIFIAEVDGHLVGQAGGVMHPQSNAYRKLGFEPTGAPAAHPTYPVMTEQRLTRGARQR